AFLRQISKPNSQSFFQHRIEIYTKPDIPNYQFCKLYSSLEPENRIFKFNRNIEIDSIKLHRVIEF
ncbi:MAG: hypothetical protein NT027_02705, partial [Proteobacteria bacterium]|nr:hypothetical protein [Pseudomonadota bacterium]